ncbi:MAG: SDR family NAD(P)-dependent oxidoreductase [Bacilli bacterium]|jgi:NAD(P)-dependent dehydrogenase (short-subunit alcohol dehydrogenase family)
MRHQKYLNKNIADLSGQIAVVTGANSGLGFEVTRQLAYKGATVVMACRSQAKAEVAREKILRELPSAQLEVMAYDQADFRSIDRFVAALKQLHPRIHVLVCNAGIFNPPRKTELLPGLNLTLGTNFVGLYYLMREITPYLDQAGTPTRVIFVSSIAAYHVPGYRFDHVLGDNISTYEQYANSKLAIDRLFHVLAQGMNLFDFQDRKNVSFFLTHPGITATNITHYFPRWLTRLADFVLKVFVHMPEKAALTITRAAGAPYVFNGSYFVPRGLFEISGLPKKRAFPKRMVKGSGQFIYDVGKYLERIDR